MESYNVQVNNLPKKKKRIVVGLILAVIITVVAVVVSHPLNQQQSSQNINIDEIIPLLNDGDIICRMGDRIWSQFFRDLSPTERRFSHLGIVRIRDDEITVIHSEPLQDGDDVVTEVPLEKFLSFALSAGVFRLHDLEGHLVSDTAMEFIGRPFDWQFNMEDDSKLYCTELLYVVLKKIDPSIELNTVWMKELRRYIIPLDVCSQTEYFTEIGYWGM